MDAISTSNPRTADGSAGSASTNGAPPSASPPQSKGCCSAVPRSGGADDGALHAVTRRSAARKRVARGTARLLPGDTHAGETRHSAERCLGSIEAEAEIEITERRKEIILFMPRRVRAASGFIEPAIF